MPLVVAVADDLDATLEHVVAELRTSWPQRRIESTFSLRRSVTCDASRIGQMWSNLLANALAHGDPDGPVSVRASADETGFELSVANCGEPIPTGLLGDLFKPFARVSEGSAQKGLGLGLYIASQIARAHGGTLDVASTPEETRFTFRMEPVTQ